jgi:hypothetical protein
MKTPVKLGTYDDAGMIVDADGNELFSVGQNEDTHTLSEQQRLLAEDVIYKINQFQLLGDSRAHAWKVAKSLQAQVTLLEDSLKNLLKQVQQLRET